MSKLFYVKKIVRSDGEQLVIDQHEIYLAEDNELLVRPEPRTSFEDYTEANGGEMIRQQLPSFVQTLNGLIVAKENDYFTIRTRMTAFFKINFTYFIVYEKISGETFTQGEKFKSAAAWIENNFQAPPTPKEEYSEWSVGLRIGSPLYQEYAEDSSGKETYANIVNVPLVSLATGGQVWDSVGQVWDSVGQLWEAGEGGIQNVAVQSASVVYPCWVVAGEAVNPTLRNNANGTEASFTGTVGAGQTLTVDFEAGTAKLDGVTVTRQLSGTLRLDNGENLIAFDTDGGSAQTSTIKWNNFLS